MPKETKKPKVINKIKDEVNSLRKSLLNLYFQKSTGQLEKTSEIKKVKKKIATLMHNIRQEENTNA